MRHFYGSLSTGASLRSTETRLPLQFYVTELLEILKYLRQKFMKRDRLECMHKARTYFPILTFRYTGFMPAFTNPVYLTVIVFTHQAHGLCVIVCTHHAHGLCVIVCTHHAHGLCVIVCTHQAHGLCVIVCTHHAHGLCVIVCTHHAHGLCVITWR